MLPAYAGMIRFGVVGGGGVAGAPRVCGDDPVDYMAEVSEWKCSPRMRG